MQSEALARQVLADDRHAQVRALLAAVLLRVGVPVVAGRVRPSAHLPEQGLPLLVGQTAAVPVGARVLAAVVEEALVVVLRLEGRDLALDELVELEEVGGDVGGNLEVHGCPQVGRRGGQ